MPSGSRCWKRRTLRASSSQSLTPKQTLHIPSFVPQTLWHLSLPDVNSSAAPSLPTVGGGIPALAKPTTAESHAAGKEEYQTGLPQVTAKPFTPEWAQQQEQELEYKKAHPLGSDVSAKPGFWGKLEHGLGRAANIAGDILAPGLTMGVPGSDLNNRLQENHFQKQFTTGLANQAEEEGNQLVPWTNPATGETQEVERRQWAPLGAAEVKANTAARCRAALVRMRRNMVWMRAR